MKPQRKQLLTGLINIKVFAEWFIKPEVITKAAQRRLQTTSQVAITRVVKVELASLVGQSSDTIK